MAIGSGATNSITNRLTSNGSNLLKILAGRSKRPTDVGQAAHPYLTYADYDPLLKSLTDVAGIAPAYQARYTVTQSKQTANISVTPVTEMYLKVHTFVIDQGRGIDAADRTKENLVAVIGATAVQDLFPIGSPLGCAIRINNENFTIVGNLKSKGFSGFTNENEIVMIPLENGSNPIHSFFLVTS